jgi:hypothetical protein
MTDIQCILNVDYVSFDAVAHSVYHLIFLKMEQTSNFYFLLVWKFRWEIMVILQ